MEWLDVVPRISGGENARTEFKRSLADLKPIGRTLAAFANTDGGVLIIGVDDGGEVVGVAQDPESASERITAFLQSDLSTPVQARIGRYEHASGWVHWIDVPRQRGYEPIAYDGRVFVRRGRANVQPSLAETQDLYNLFGYILTEERTIAAARIDAIDVQAFRAHLDRLGLDLTTEPQPDLADDLRTRGVLAEIDGELRATLYGALAFGRTPQSYGQTGNFWVECVAYNGKDARTTFSSSARRRAGSMIRWTVQSDGCKGLGVSSARGDSAKGRAAGATRSRARGRGQRGRTP